MSPGALSGLAAGLVFLSFAASTPSMAKAPPSPPGPARPKSQKVVIRPVPEAPGHYLLQQNRADTLFTSTGLSLRLTPPERPVRDLQWGVVGARAMTPQPLEPREARFHQFVGAPENWKRNLPTWGALYYPQVSPGVDLWFEAQEGGVTYSLRAERGANLRQVRLEWRGAQALRLAEGGRALEVVLADGVLREEGLLCGQEAADGTSFEVPCRYRSVHPKGPGLWEYVIEVDVKQPGLPAWVDPTLDWNTFLGGIGDDSLRALAVQDFVDSQGSSFVVGSTNSQTVSPLPLGSRPVAVHGIRSMSDVVVTRFTNYGSVEWTAILGGSNDDVGTAIAFGVDGYIYIAGFTASGDFPQGGIDPGVKEKFYGGPRDGFVARLRADGTSLAWVQLLGHARDEEILSLAVGPAQAGDTTQATRKLYVAGWTSSDTLPAADVGDSKESKELFVSRLDYLSGDVERTLIRRGNGDEVATGLAVEKDLVVNATHLYVTGYTTSSNFPFKAGHPFGLVDSEGTAMVFKLDQDLAASPLWDQPIGAQGYDRSSALVLTGDQVTIVGTTRASAFPTTDNTHPVGRDAFLAGFNAQAGYVLFSTVVGGPGNEEGLALTPGSAGSFYIGGSTTSTSLPGSEETVDAASSGGEGFVIRMAREGAGFVPEWSFFVGGSQGDEVRALATFTSPPGLVVGGVTQSETLVRPAMGLEGGKRVSSGGGEMFLFTMNARDLTPPKGLVLDGPDAPDRDSTESTTTLEANWEIDDPESPLKALEVSVGTAPGCNDIMDLTPVPVNSTSISLSSTSGGWLSTALRTGRYYFVNVRATNGVDIRRTISSDGIFVLPPGGDPNNLPTPPSRPASADLCGKGPDGPDGGDGNPGPAESPLGFSCGTPGGPTGLVLLVVVAFGLLSARRKSWN